MPPPPPPPGAGYVKTSVKAKKEERSSSPSATPTAEDQESNMSVNTVESRGHLRVKTEKGRTHICSHIRYAQLLYIWTCIASGSGGEIVVQLVVTTMLCFLARWIQGDVRGD